jgi:hypothetical protein
LWKEHHLGQANHSWSLWRWISLAEWLEMADRGWWRAGYFAAGNALAPNADLMRSARGAEASAAS